MFARTRTLTAVALLVLAGPFAGAASAQSSKETAVRLLNDKDRAKAVLLFTHFGTDYVGHTYNGSGKVVDRYGTELPGHFCLQYTYDWKVGGQFGTTTLKYLFNDKGILTEIQVYKTNAVFNQPFLLANASIKILGEALYDKIKDDLSESDRKLFRKIVDDADAKGLLQFGLRINLAANSR